MVRNKNTPRMSASHSLSLSASTANSDHISKSEDIGQSSSPLKRWKNNRKPSLPTDRQNNLNGWDDKISVHSTGANHAKQNKPSVALVKLTNCNGHANDEHQQARSLSPTSKATKPETSQQIDNIFSRMHASATKTNTYRKMFGRYKVGQELLARWSDGLYYIGVICDVSLVIEPF